MKILMLVQYFHLPDEPGGSRAFQFARRWAALGHDVTVLTGNVNYKTGRVIRPQAGRTWSLLKHPDGFRVYRLWTYAQFRGSFRKRLLFFASYAAHAALAGSVGGRPDVVFASSTPLTVGLPGWWLARRYRCPFVFELRDLWPEAAVAAGVMRSPRWIARTRKLASFLYARADHLIAVTEGIRDGILGYGVPGEKVTLVPNGVDDWMDPERFGTEPAVSEADPKLFTWKGFPGPAINAGGQGGSYFYIKSRNSKPNFEAMWNFSPGQSGYYDVYAYIPASARATQSAVYQVFHGGQLSPGIVIDQTAQPDQWVLVGNFYFAGERLSQYIYLSNQTSEGTATRDVLVDAVMIIYTP